MLAVHHKTLKCKCLRPSGKRQLLSIPVQVVKVGRGERLIDSVIATAGHYLDHEIFESLKGLRIFSGILSHHEYI